MRSQWNDPRSRPSGSGASALRPRTSGFTLVEVSIVVGVVGLVFGGAFWVVARSEDHLAEASARMTAVASGRRIVDRIAGELTSALPQSVLPVILDSSPYITFARVTAFNGSAPVLGPIAKITSELAPGETQNGRDDNGDGIPDERIVVLYSSSPQTREIIADNVLDLRFTATATGLIFTLDVAASRERKGWVEQSFVRELSSRY